MEEKRTTLAEALQEEGGWPESAINGAFAPPRALIGRRAVTYLSVLSGGLIIVFQIDDRQSAKAAL